MDRWDAGDVREVFHATRSRAEAAFEAADGIAELPVFGTWGGAASDAAKHAVGVTRMDLDAHGNEAMVVARAASKAADEIQQVKDDLAALRAEAQSLGMAIDSATSSVVAGPGAAGAPPMEIELKIAQLQPKLTAILAEAAAADAALTQAITMATGDAPLPASPPGMPPAAPAGQPGQSLDKQNGTAAAPRTGDDFLTQWQNELTRPGVPAAADKPAAPAPALDPTTPQGKAAADQMRKLLQQQGVPPDQVDARIADVFARAQQPLPAAPKPEPPTKQPAPGFGERLGDAFNDFTNDVHEGFYDRLDQTVDGAKQTFQTAQDLTGTGGEGRPGVVDSWKQLFLDNAKSVASDPLGAMAGPGNPITAFTDAPGELSRAIDNPGHYLGEKLFDGTAVAATMPFGGEGALSRALLPELRAVEHGAMPGAGGLTHDAVPAIPHSVIDPATGATHSPPVVNHHTADLLPPAHHDVPVSGDHQLPPTGHLPPTGEPSTFGYDADGNRLPYANYRPPYGPVWPQA